MSKLLFCNIGWMSRYEGQYKKPDKIVGGGAYVKTEKWGGEVCNFLACDDGFVYGHVETIHGTRERRIRMSYLGGDDEATEMVGVDVIWTATDPTEGGRRIVGWYKGATVYRDRQKFPAPPSKQHQLEGIGDFRIKTHAPNAHRLDIEERTITLGRGPGWMGHTQWWSPSATDPEIEEFERKVRSLIAGGPRSSPNATRPAVKPSSPSAAKTPYTRYVEAFEITINPMHDDLQERFERFLEGSSTSNIRSNVESVDLRYVDSNKALVLVEIKPCTKDSARFAVRTAMGQLLDYKQSLSKDTKLLIVLGERPDAFDQKLALSNNFGIAFPSRKSFNVVWPA